MVKVYHSPFTFGNNMLPPTSFSFNVLMFSFNELHSEPHYFQWLALCVSDFLLV